MIKLINVSVKKDDYDPIYNEDTSIDFYIKLDVGDFFVSSLGFLEEFQHDYTH